MEAADDELAKKVLKRKDPPPTETSAPAPAEPKPKQSRRRVSGKRPDPEAKPPANDPVADGAKAKGKAKARAKKTVATEDTEPTSEANAPPPASKVTKAKAPKAKANETAATEDTEPTSDANVPPPASKVTKPKAAKAKTNQDNKQAPQADTQAPQGDVPDPNGDSKLEALKQKRRERAGTALGVLRKAKEEEKINLGDLVLPEILGNRISFTLEDPEDNTTGSKIRVILAGESFYVTEVKVDKSHWPSTCATKAPQGFLCLPLCKHIHFCKGGICSTLKKSLRDLSSTCICSLVMFCLFCTDGKHVVL